MNTEDRIVTNNFGVKDFADMNFGAESSDRLVVIACAIKPSIGILDVTGLDEEERDGLVQRYLSNLTFGCNYRYRIVEKIGNTYFCDMCTIDQKFGNHYKHISPIEAR